MHDFERTRIDNEILSKEKKKIDAILAIDFLMKKHNQTYEWAVEIAQALGLHETKLSMQDLYSSSWIGS